MGSSRLDQVLIERGLVSSIEKARLLISQGFVEVDGRIEREIRDVTSDSKIQLKERAEYVGRGAYKLISGLDGFKLNVNNLICADVGSSTGGFTEVLLLRGASKVYAIDVGYGELDWRLRNDKRVVVMERTNARYLERLPEQVDFVSVDLSFISVKMVLPNIIGWLRSDESKVLVLVKPQFEAPKGSLEDGGIITDKKVHDGVINDIESWATANKFKVLGWVESALEGMSGNKEFFMCCSKTCASKGSNLGPAD